jgi:hypothetical protein
VENSEANNGLIVSFLTLRRLIGILGIALPLSILLYSFFIRECGCRCGFLESSISAYYHTGMRNIFEGILCAVGVFMMTYKGFDHIDTIASIVAGICAVGVAFFPTNELAMCGTNEYIPAWVGNMHYAFAAVLFLTFAIMSLALFTKTDKTKTPTPEKHKRNAIYKVCGYVILLCVALMFVHKVIGSFLPQSMNPVFWLETISLFAFGTSWLVKG